jgi:drug/metabolite transporter (DMT)-like permease
VVQIGVAYMFLARGIEGVPAFEASLLLLVEPALNPVWAWLVLGEQPSAWAIVGAVIIFGATTVRTWLESRNAKVLARVAPAP